MIIILNNFVVAERCCQSRRSYAGLFDGTSFWLSGANLRVPLHVASWPRAKTNELVGRYL